MYEQVGIAGLHIEDQSTPPSLPPSLPTIPRQGISEFVRLMVVSPKRCGHLLGKVVVSREEYASRISAASAAKSTLPSAPVLIARYPSP